MIVNTKQDITKLNSGIIAHGVNCKGVMNSGFARVVRTIWPLAYEKYIKNGKGKHLLGSSSFVKITDDIWVVNCYTQEFYGRDSNVKYASADAIEKSLTTTLKYIDMVLPNLSLHMPQICCGLGGLNWDSDVNPIVENLSNQYSSIDIYIHTL